MSLAIMCSGGDCAGMNPAIKKFVDYVHKLNITPYFIYEGLEGLIDNKIKIASHKDVAGIIHNGGTIIKSSRSKRFFEYKYRKQAYENLLKNNITGIVVLGGDGSFRALDIFSKEFDINFVGIPSTIDNDINGTQYCLGCDTALNVIRDSLDKIRDTASSFNRAFVVEVMGRDCGYLALISSLISGAEICVIPELIFEKEQVEKKLLEEIKDGRSYILAIVAEGTKKTIEIATWLRDEIGFDTRITILGHVQRGGNPSVYDRVMAFEFVIEAINHLKQNSNSNKVITYNDGLFELKNIDEVVSKKYQIPQKLLDSVRYLD